MTNTSWPENVLDAIEPSLASYMPDFVVVRRSLRPQDPALTISLRAGGWMPDQSSIEIHSTEPTSNTYSFELELLVKHADEAEGRALYTVNAKLARAVLYRDAALLVRLRALSEDLLGSRESFLRMRIESQKYINNTMNKAWFFVATTRFRVDTETTAI